MGKKYSRPRGVSATSLLKLDGFLLHGVFVPMILLAATAKVGAVFSVSIVPPRGWALLDFLRLHLGYYLLFYLWGRVMLSYAQQSHDRVRLWSGVLLLYLVITDLANSGVIFRTGALVPYDVAYYSWLAFSRNFQWLSINSVVLVQLFAIPVILLGWPLLRMRRIYAAGELRVRREVRRMASLAGGCLLLASLGPVHAQLELNHARPSLLYQLGRLLAGPQRPGLVPAGPSMLPDRLLLNGAENHAGSYNLVVIALESTSADALGFYNPQRQGVTPVLDNLARDGHSLVAEHAYTTMPHTSKALSAINCGQHPYHRHPIYESVLGLPHECLAEQLRDQGYASAWFQSPTEYFENRRGLVGQFGFDEFFPGEALPKAGFQIVNYFGYEDAIMLEPSRQWLERQKGPFFAFYLTGTTHHPYAYGAPSRYGYKYFAEAGQPLELNAYLNAVHYVDHFVGELIDQYKQLGLYESTVFVVVGDHGESIRQHGRFQHNANLYNEAMRIPLIIHSPGIQKQNRSVPSVVSQVDIVPTVLDLLGYKPNPWNTVSLFQRDDSAAIAFATCWYDEWCTALVNGRHKYIYNYDEKPEELYDLKSDPEETHNLVRWFPALVKEYRQQVLEHHVMNVTRYNRYYSSLDPEYRKLVKKTFRGEIGPVLADR